LKICPKCKIEKPLSDFSKCSARKHLDGVRYECKLCATAARAAWAKKNPEKIRQYEHAHYIKNSDEIKQRSREWAAANRERKSNYDKNYRLNNVDRLSLHSKIWREENREMLSIKRKIYAAFNKEKIVESRKAFYARNRDRLIKAACDFKKENRGLYNFYGAKRKQRIKDATPKWLSQKQLEDIKDFYIAATVISTTCGESYQVDHIIPICGENVCGLHVPWNLQILTASENASKGNRLIL